jgi:hypothetical protein
MAQNSSCSLVNTSSPRFRIGTGRVEAVIDDDHYLVRFDPGSDGSPEAFAVVALDDMVRAGREDEEEGPVHWLFFDTAEDRAKFRAWMETPEDPNKPRVVPMRRY